MSTGNPDLFVVCRSCGSEVSPYITECPYCGNRLRKRAPKIDRDGRVAEQRRRRPPAPSLPRLRRGEIPGIRPESRPVRHARAGRRSGWSAAWSGGPRWSISPTIAIIDCKPGSHWWRLITTPFVYGNTGYAFVALGAIAIYGWLLERRHGPLPVLGTVRDRRHRRRRGDRSRCSASRSCSAANGAALALLTAWAIPDLLALRRREEIEGDLLGTRADRRRGRADAARGRAATPSWISDGVGVLGGIAIGLPLALTQEY